MKKILLNILVVIFCFVSVPESCVGARNKYLEIRNNTTTITTPMITVSDPIAAKKKAVLENFNNLLQDTEWQKKLGENEKKLLKGWNMQLTRTHIGNMLDHTKRNHHIITREFKLHDYKDIYDDKIILKEGASLATLTKHRDLLKEINKLEKENDDIEKRIEKLNYSSKISSHISSSDYRSKRKHSPSSDNHYSKKRKTANDEKNKLESLQEKFKDNKDKILLKKAEIKENSLQKKILQSFNLETEESKEAFINWAIHKKKRPQDTNNSNRAVITAIDATDKEGDEDAMLDVLLGLESINEASLDKDDNEDIHLKLVLKVKPQHYFKQTKVGDSHEIKSGSSNKMVLILTKDAWNYVHVSTMYIKE